MNTQGITKGMKKSWDIRWQNLGGGGIELFQGDDHIFVDPAQCIALFDQIGKCKQEIAHKFIEDLEHRVRKLENPPKGRK